MKKNINKQMRRKIYMPMDVKSVEEFVFLSNETGSEEDVCSKKVYLTLTFNKVWRTLFAKPK
jgi:hypothetical protein